MPMRYDLENLHAYIDKKVNAMPMTQYERAQLSDRLVLVYN